MRQKLALICTLIHLPDVLLLDEPTTGVDPISRQEFWQIIRRVVEERGTTVLLSTSYMDEAERCHRIALLHSGTIVAEGTPEAVRQRASGRFASVTAAPQPLALQILRLRPEVRGTEVFGDEIHLQFDGDLRHIESALTERGIVIRDLAVQEAGLEDVFLQLTGGVERKQVTFHFEPTPAPATITAIECREVSRRFDAFTAVDRVDLSVPHGEIFGLLGPNGAGKTTLIKMMCGLLEPSAGVITIGGVNVRTERERVWTAIGYMSQRFSLYQDLSVRQNLQLYADLYGVARPTYMGLMMRLGLEPFASRLTKDLPTGVRQRVSLMCAVLHRPPIVFLDEPTSGVDPQARRVFWDLIYSLSREAAVTVLVSTHYMDEAVHCDRLGLMDQGRLVAVGSPIELKQQSERRSGSLLAIDADDIRRAYGILLQERPGAALYGHRIHVRSLDAEADDVALTSVLEREGIRHVRIERVPLSMDDTFIDFIRAAEAVRA
jgi:ABC-2 type transport system ATP-binding protein